MVEGRNVMLRLADIEGGTDQDARLVAGPLADDLRTQRVGAQQAIGAVLFGGADGDQDGLGAGQIGLDLGPGGKMKLHQTPCGLHRDHSTIVAETSPKETRQCPRA
jgi:hypothetical protein